MGICSHAKEIICSSKLCDVPVYVEDNKPNVIQNINDNQNNNSLNIENNVSINKNTNNNSNNIQNTNNNNQISNETANNPNEQNGRKKKSILIKEEVKMDNINIQSMDEKKEVKEVKEVKNDSKHKNRSKKKVGFMSAKEMTSENKSESRFLKGRTDIKIVVLGSSGTGKTSFCNLWVNNTFSEEYKATVMSEFSFKMYNYKGNYYKVQIWDLAGQDKNIYTSKVFTKGAHGCLILYDTQDKKSFENTIKWKKTVDDNTTFIDGTPLPIVLVQNKIDLVEAEALEGDEEELKKFVDENKFLTFTRTSCKNNQNVNETMDFLLANIIDRLEDYHKKANIPIDNNKRTSIVIQNPSASSESLLNSNKNFCCV